MDIKPCVGCVKCAKNNRRVMVDDMFPLYDEIVESDAIVVGAVVYFRKANGFTHNFLERFFPLRHKKPQTMEKPGLYSFYVKKYKAYTGRNPKTGEPRDIKPKKLPFFKCGKELKELVDNQN